MFVLFFIFFFLYLFVHCLVVVCFARLKNNKQTNNNVSLPSVCMSCCLCTSVVQKTTNIVEKPVIISTNPTPAPAPDPDPDSDYDPSVDRDLDPESSSPIPDEDGPKAEALISLTSLRNWLKRIQVPFINEYLN